MKTDKQIPITILLFAQDMRLADNAALHAAIADAQTQGTCLLLLHCIAPRIFNQVDGGAPAIGEARWQFLLSSIQDLKEQLNEQQIILNVSTKDWYDSVVELATEFNIQALHLGAVAGLYETQEIKAIKELYPVITHDNNTLYTLSQLPFGLIDLPKHFTPFRKQVEGLLLPDVLPPPKVWAQSCHSKIDQWSKLEPLIYHSNHTFKGGERAGLSHLKQYMSSDLPSSYKQVRNELMGWEHSTKFSAWLALGCISPRQIMQQLNRYERENGANDSTYWIFFELLWREFFYWNALKQGHRLFYSVKPKQHAKADVDLDAANKYKNWCVGTTDEPLINACMRQLNQTGYISNRGRQIAASFLVNEMNADWRLGAAYFEQQLIDYDVASNWGNWQYIAGVGADPRGGRHFNLEKQQKTHDPNGCFVEKWANFKVSTETVIF